MHRLAVLRARGVVLAGCLLLGLANAVALAGNPPALSGGGVKIDLKQQLEMGLRARRPVEFEYIAQIVDLVNKGKLPESLVTSTFGYAIKKPDRQLQYFQFALQERAKDLNVKLPDLSRQTVGVVPGATNR